MPGKSCLARPHGHKVGRPIAHGTMQMNLIFAMLGQSCGEAGLRAALDIRFLKPVREGERVSAGGRLADPASGTYEVWVKTAAGEIVIAGTARVP